MKGDNVMFYLSSTAHTLSCADRLGLPSENENVALTALGSFGGWWFKWHVSSSHLVYLPGEPWLGLPGRRHAEAPGCSQGKEASPRGAPASCSCHCTLGVLTIYPIRNTGAAQDEEEEEGLEGEGRKEESKQERTHLERN